jgi:hypothetical protein
MVQTKFSILSILAAAAAIALVVARPLPGEDNLNLMDWNTVNIDPASGLPHWPKDSVDSVPAQPE